MSLIVTILSKYFISQKFNVAEIFKWSSAQQISALQNQKFNFCDDSKNNKKQILAMEEKGTKLPEEPTNCCMSGCTNCVWKVYAEELCELLENGDEIARQKVMEQVKDPNIRAFILMELDEVMKKKK